MRRPFYHSVFFYLSLSIVIAFYMLFSTQTIFAQVSSTPPYSDSNTAVPSHEAKIILLSMHEQIFYSLDTNGLLKVNNTNTKQASFYNPVRAHIKFAHFLYPYIVIVDTESNFHLYNIENNFVIYASYVPNISAHAFALSPDATQFAYGTYGNNNKEVFVLNTETWDIVSQYTYKGSELSFLYISKDNRNIMSFHTRGEIEYKNILNQSVIKDVYVETSLNKFFLNKTLRYGVGYLDNSLITIDAIEGNIVDSIIFVDTIKDIFLSENEKSSYNLINVVVQKSNGNQNIKTFKLHTDGSLEENIITNLAVDSNVSTIESNNEALYVGLDNGKILIYDLSPNQISKSRILADDNTLAIYDAIYQENSIVISNIEGLIKIPFSPSLQGTPNTNTSPANSIQKFSHPLKNPTFLIDNFNPNNIKVLISNIPYEHTFLHPYPNTYYGEENTFSSNSSLQSLVYQVDTDTLQINEPLLVAQNISNAQLAGNYLLDFSSLNSYFYVDNVISKKSKKYSLNNVKFIYDVLQYPYNQSKVLWTNTPINDIGYKVDAINVLYSYNLDFDNQAAYPPFILSSIHHDIYHVIALAQNPPAFVIATHTPQNQSILYYISMPPESTTNDKKTSFYPKHTKILTEIPNTHVLKIIPFPTDRNKLLMVTTDTINVISTNDEGELEYLYERPVPKNLGIIYNARIQARSDKEFIITLIDKNNLVSVLTLRLPLALTHEITFHIENNNSIVYYKN